MLEAIVGSVAAEKVLLYLQNYEQAYGREIAATFDISNSQVQKQLLKLESGGLLVSQAHRPHQAVSVEPAQSTCAAVVVRCSKSR